MEDTEPGVVDVVEKSEVMDKVEMETAVTSDLEASKKETEVDKIETEADELTKQVSKKVTEDVTDLVNESPPIDKSEVHKAVDCADMNPVDDCDICINTANEITSAAETRGSDKESKKKAFELMESVNSQEETTDDSNDEEMQQFLGLMNKAERKNHRKISAVQTFHFGSSARNSQSDWRNVTMDDPESDTTDTDDEDDNVETRRFLSLMGKAKQAPVSRPMVTIKWQDGKVVGLPDNIKVTRVPQGEEVRSRHDEDLIRRRKEHMEAVRRDGPISTMCSGKRKFEDRMTLSEAKAEDFTDTKDYVDFIQAKLKNVNIKIIK